MTITKPNPGGWGYKEVLTSAQANLMQDELAKAIDGYAGGYYNPSSPLNLSNVILGGATLNSCSVGYENPPFATGGANAGPLTYSQEMLIGNPSVEWHMDTVSARYEQVTTGGGIIFPLHLSRNCTIKSIGFVFQGASTATVKPSTLPKMTLSRRLKSNPASSISTLYTLNDTATDLTGYKSSRFVESSIYFTLDHETYSYYLIFSGPGGSDWVAGSCMYGVMYSYVFYNCTLVL